MEMPMETTIALWKQWPSSGDGKTELKPINLEDAFSLSQDAFSQAQVTPRTFETKLTSKPTNSTDLSSVATPLEGEGIWDDGNNSNAFGSMPQHDSTAHSCTYSASSSGGTNALSIGKVLADTLPYAAQQLPQDNDDDPDDDDSKDISTASDTPLMYESSGPDELKSKWSTKTKRRRRRMLLKK